MPTKTKPTATTVSAMAPAAKPPSRSVLVLKLLARTRGATAAELGEPTGWQLHSVRAYLSGLRKQGRAIVREQRKTGETVYRIVEGSSPEANAAAKPDAGLNVPVDAAAAVAPEATV